MVRTPVPIKSEVEALISAYRNQVIESDNADSESVSKPEIEQAIKLVYEFINQRGLSDKLPEYKRYRDMRELVRFLEWLQSGTL